MMFVAALVATSLVAALPVVSPQSFAPPVWPVSIERNAPLTLEPGIGLSSDQKDATVQPLVSSATECIARTVSADPRFSPRESGAAVNNLIVESVPSCLDVLRSMIGTYDRVYGDGAGETFFAGPYLDGLPEAVTRRIKNVR
jgi:hypothetical protein